MQPLGFSRINQAYINKSLSLGIFAFKSRKCNKILLASLLHHESTTDKASRVAAGEPRPHGWSSAAFLGRCRWGSSPWKRGGAPWPAKRKERHRQVPWTAPLPEFASSESSTAHEAPSPSLLEDRAPPRALHRRWSGEEMRPGGGSPHRSSKKEPGRLWGEGTTPPVERSSLRREMAPSRQGRGPPPYWDG